MLSIVIPVYNSEKILPSLCKKIRVEMNRNNYTYELILVNDGSKDNSENVIRELALRDKNIRAIFLSKNAGQQNSTLAGIRHSSFDMVLTMDDDLQHSPSSIKTLIDSLDDKTHIVYGVPSQLNTKNYRTFGTFLKELCFFLFLGKPKGIRLTSFRIMRGDILQWIKEDPLPKVYISARALQQKPSIKNVHVPFNERFEGSSNYTVYSLVSKLLALMWNYKFKKKKTSNDSNNHQYIIKEILK